MFWRLGNGLFLLFCACPVTEFRALAQAGDAAYQRGASYYRGGNCTAAIPELKAAAASVPRANLLLSRCYFEVRQYDKAAEAIGVYQKAAPSDSAGVVFLAQIQERDGHASSAVALLETYLQQNPGLPEIHNALGDLYSRLGQSPLAMSQYHEVTGLESDNPGARIGLGELALRQRRFQESIDEFEKARPAVPNDYRLLSGLGTAYFELGSCELATGPLKRALQLGPDNFALAKILATCFTRMRKWADVLAALRTGTPEEADDQEATAMVLQALENTKDTVGAEAYLRRVLSSSSANTSAHMYLGDMLYDGKRLPEASAEYLEVVTLAPDSPRIHERLGDMARLPEETAEARRHYEAAARSSKGADSARMKLARLCFSAEDMACTNSALADIKDPALNRDVTLLRLQVEYRAQNWGRAWAIANELLAVDRGNLAVLRIAGEVAARQNKPLDATVLLEQALALDLSNKDLRYRLAGIYSNNDELNRVPRAVELLRDFLNKYQQDAEGFMLLGNAYRKLNDLNNAKASFTQGFLRVTPPVPARLSWAYNSYGYMLLSEMKYEEAYVYLTQAVQLNTADELSLLNFALTCLELGRIEELNLTRTKLQALNSRYLPRLDQEIGRKAKSRGKTAK